MVVSVRGGGGPGGDIELVEDIAHVPVDCALAQAQLGGDGLIRMTGGNQAKHMEFTRGKGTGWGVAAGAASRRSRSGCASS